MPSNISMSQLTSLINSKNTSLIDKSVPSTSSSTFNRDYASSISTDKQFESLSANNQANSNNSFSILDSKETVVGLSGQKSDSTSNKNVESMNTDNYISLSNKSGSDIQTDADLDKSINSAMGSMSDNQQMSLDSGDALTRNPSLNTVSDEPKLFKGDIVFTDAGVIPSSMSMSKVDTLLDIVNNTVGISLDLCEMLKAGLSLGIEIIDLAKLLANLNILVDLQMQFDIPGLMACIGGVIGKLDVISSSKLVGSLKMSTAIHSNCELAAFPAVQALSYSPQSDFLSIGNGMTSSSQSDEMNNAALAYAIEREDAMKARFDENLARSSGNSSNSNSSSVYDLNTVQSSNQNFSSYCISDSSSNDMLRSVPSSSFEPNYTSQLSF